MVLDSAPAVGSWTRTRRSCGVERIPAKPRTRGSQGPAPSIDFSEGAGRESNLLSHGLHSGSRVCFVCRQMLSAGACFKKMTDEVFEPEIDDALPLSYGATW